MQPDAPQNPSNQPRSGPPGTPSTPANAPANPPAGVSKIQHSRPGIGLVTGASSPTPMTPLAPVASQSPGDAPPSPSASSDLNAPPPPPGSAGSKIRMFGQDKRHEETWSRTPNTTGSGAIHVKSFHCKLTEDALQYMDQSINEWLDAHPQYEVKFVGSTIGTMTGKLKEPALICQVWV